jgi:hypothetical protein
MQNLQKEWVAGLWTEAVESVYSPWWIGCIPLEFRFDSQEQRGAAMAAPLGARRRGR